MESYVAYGFIVSFYSFNKESNLPHGCLIISMNIPLKLILRLQNSVSWICQDLLNLSSIIRNSGDF